VKLRGRFTVTLALAALVPIVIAAVITRQVIAASYTDEYRETRRSVEQSMLREVARLSSQVHAAVASLASPDHPFVGGLLRELVKGTLDAPTERRLREQGGPVMRGLSLQLLTLTDPSDRVMVSPHNRAEVGEPNPVVRQRAERTKGETYFVREKITRGPTVETVLVAQAAQLSRDGRFVVALWAGRTIDNELLTTVRREGRIDARIVAANGDVLQPSVAPNWGDLSADPPIRIPLAGPDGVPIAFIEVAVSDNNLAGVLREVTYISAGLAVGALALVVLAGVFVARRIARDLDALVEGSLHAARGDLDYRVPVRGQDEIGAVASAFNFMMEDLRTSKDRLVIAERIAAWQEIARRLAHEIKNPLTPIQMAMDTLRKVWKKQHPQFGEILEESTETVLEEADRLKRIVSEFSDFARMPKPELQRVDLNDVVKSVTGLYQGAIRVETKLAKIPDIDADKGQINQVVLNLVENARDAIGERSDGKITVQTKLGDAGDRAVLIVDDNGPGVPTELKDKIFAPYFSTKLNKGGTGLGLAIVHRIVSDHGGRIQITDALGGGARFLIELPLRNATSLLASRI